MSDGESRIHLLNNGRSPRFIGGDLITRKQASQLVADAEQRAHDRCLDVVNHMMEQIPGKVAAMLAEALAANGIEMKGPEAPATEPETPA